MIRLYRLCMRALPRDFLRRHGAEMEALFHESWDGATSPWRKLRVLVGSLVDLARGAVTLRRGPTTPPRPEKGTRSSMMETLWLDLKFAARSLRKRAGFAALATATLAVGIGAVTAVFSVVNGVLLRPLPYHASERITIIWHDLGNGAQSLPALNPLDFFDYRERSRRFEDWTIATGRESVLGEEGEPELVDVGRVAANFFSFFGVVPLHGRAFTSDEDAPGGAEVAILSHRLWSRRFGADPHIVGRTIRLGGVERRVVGVLPAWFRLQLPAEAFRLRDSEIWVPAQIDRAEQPPRNYTGYTAFGRVALGVSFEEAQQEMDALEARLKEEHSVHEASNLQVRAVPLHGDVVKRARPTLRVLMLAVGLVLLIACGNAAQLLLARWRGGERELSVRAAMGAGRFRLGRLVFIEGVLLALAAGTLGALIAHALVSALPRVAPNSVPRLAEVAVDGAVLSFAVALSAASALLFSLLPALAISRANLASALGETARGGGSVRHVRARNALLVTEVALSVVLLVATGLTVRSFAALLRADPGFDPEGLLTLRVSLPSPRFSEEETRRVLHDELRRRVRELPGVESVATVNQLPLTGSGTLQPYAYDEQTARNWESVTADERYVSPGFLRTMGATLVEGRELTEDQARLGRKYVVIDELLAAGAFPGEHAVGKRLRIEPLGHEDPFAEIVGVVEHVKLHDLTRPLLPQIYFALRPSGSFSLVVRASDQEERLAGPVREIIHALAPGAAVEEIAPMEDLVAAARAPARLSLVLMVGFGALAIVLATVGLFGVVAYSVNQRRFELGVRIAFGASPFSIQWGVLRSGLGLVALSTVLGLAGAAVLGRFLAGFLYGVDPVDVPTYVFVSATLGLAALAACWAPARRATRVDPSLALRVD